MIVLSRVPCFTQEMENMLITAANNVDTSKVHVAVPETVQSTYQQDIDAHELELQLQLLPDFDRALRQFKHLTYHHKSGQHFG